jgi:hypothetical protein
VLAACAVCAHAAQPSPDSLEQKMFELLNTDRKEHQKAPLKYDDSLADVARAHSRDMLDNDYFAHAAPRTGHKVADRLWKARVRVIGCGENIAMNRSIKKAQAKLMKSPGHRRNILSEIFTHCGIGIVRASNGTYYITQVFAAPAPEVDLETLAADLLKKVNKRRVDKGKLPLKLNRQLCRIAGRQAAATALAGKRLKVDPAVLAKAAGLKYRRLSMASQALWDPIGLARAGFFLRPKVGRVGLGFAPNNTDKKRGYGIIWTVVILTHE